MNNKAFFSMSYGLYVIGTNFEGKNAACVANTLTQVTSQPPKVSITLNKENFTTGLLEKAGRFTASVLTEGTTMEVIGEFGFKTSRDTDKFQGTPHGVDAFGQPYLTHSANAYFSCQVEERVDLGTHIMFIAQVVGAEVLSTAPSMTYAYYHQVKKGATPKNAPSYLAETQKSGYKCTVCGYISEQETLPEGFKCPICGQPPSAFEKL